MKGTGLRGCGYAEVATDNKNRNFEIRHILSRHGGNLKGTAVSWMFHKKGYIVVERGGRMRELST
jgi:transcriptional/translational regulatory protein YebC/TACO1